MTILAELLRKGRYQLPVKFFEKDSGYYVNYGSDERRQSGCIRIFDKDKQLVEQISLPEHFIEDMLIEYINGCFRTLAGKDNDLTTISRELTSIDRSLYTTKDEQNDHPDRPQLDGDTPAVQPGGLVEPALATARRWIRANNIYEVEQEHRDGRWAPTGRVRGIFDNRTRPAPVAPTPDVRQNEQQPGITGQAPTLVNGGFFARLGHQD